MQHAAERVERPGESQEALDGKKYLNGASNNPQGGTRFRMLTAQFWTLRKANTREAQMNATKI